MRKLVLVMMVLACVGLALSACGGSSGPHCVKNPMYCDPACDFTAGKFCCNNTCIDMKTCNNPACSGNQVCDPCSGTCVNMPKDCTPACKNEEYCDDGTCKPIPVCNPQCKEGEEICVP